MIRKLLIIILLNITFSYSQNIKINNLDYKNNLNSLTVHLAATKLCKNFYSTKDLIKDRQNKSNYLDLDKKFHYTCHVCTESIKYPYTSPLESFAERFLKDRRIFKNKSNVFALREIRKEIKKSYQKEYYKKVDSVDTENLVYYDYGLIRGYSFDVQKMYFEMFSPTFRLPHPNSSNLIRTPYLIGNNIKNDAIYANSLISFQIPIAENVAENIYKNYAKHYHPNPPFAVAMKLNYALRLSPKLEGKPRYYNVVYKKVEFFLPNPENIKKINHHKLILDNYDSEKKIAEIIFNDKIYRTKHNQTYQKYIDKK